MKAGGDGSSRSPLARRIAVAVVGGTVTLGGIAMIVLPGPALIVIPLGLSILATEFPWARRYLRKCRTAATRWKEKIVTRAKGRSAGKTAVRSLGAPSVTAPARAYARRRGIRDGSDD